MTVRFALKRDRDGTIVAADGQTGGRAAAADGTYTRTLTLDGCGPDDPVGATYTVAVFEYTPERTPALGPGASATFTVAR